MKNKEVMYVLLIGFIVGMFTHKLIDTANYTNTANYTKLDVCTGYTVGFYSRHLKREFDKEKYFVGSC